MWCVLLSHLFEVLLPMSLKLVGVDELQVVTFCMTWGPAGFVMHMWGLGAAFGEYPGCSRGLLRISQTAMYFAVPAGMAEAAGFDIGYWPRLFTALIFAISPILVAAMVEARIAAWGTPGRGWLYTVAAAHVVSAAVDFGWAFAGHNAPFGPALMYASYACHLAAAFVFGLFVHRARLAVAQAPDAWPSDAPAGAQ